MTDLTALQRLTLLKSSDIAQKFSEDQQRAISSDSATIYAQLDMIYNYRGLWLGNTKR
jgi:hypothetical protein